MEDLPYADQSIELPAGLSGVMGKERILVAICDNLVALIVAVVVASSTSNGSGVVRWIIAIAAFLGYYFLFEGLIGATPGKLLFGLRVKRLSGASLSWLQLGIRTLCRLIEVNPVVVGSLPACVLTLATSKHQRLGDLLAGTVVVSTSPTR